MRLIQHVECSHRCAHWYCTCGTCRTFPDPCLSSWRTGLLFSLEQLDWYFFVYTVYYQPKIRSKENVPHFLPTAKAWHKSCPMVTFYLVFSMSPWWIWMFYFIRDAFIGQGDISRIWCLMSSRSTYERISSQKIGFFFDSVRDKKHVWFSSCNIIELLVLKSEILQFLSRIDNLRY